MVSYALIKQFLKITHAIRGIYPVSSLNARRDSEVCQIVGFRNGWTEPFRLLGYYAA